MPLGLAPVARQDGVALSRSRLILAPLLLVAAGCRDRPPPGPSDAGLVVRPELTLRWGQGLPILPLAPPAPREYAAAAAHWRTATTAFALGAYDDSAQAFMAAADVLSRPDAGPLDQTLRAARCLAYENAASAFEGAAEPTAGVSALALARARDPGCQSSITRVLDRLSTRTGTTAPSAAPVPPAAAAP